MDVVPLFESGADLDHAVEVLDDMLKLEPVASRLTASGQAASSTGPAAAASGTAGSGSAGSGRAGSGSAGSGSAGSGSAGSGSAGSGSAGSGSAASEGVSSGIDSAEADSRQAGSVGARPALEVMLGYSDSAKELGPVAWRDGCGCSGRRRRSVSMGGTASATWR